MPRVRINHRMSGEEIVLTMSEKKTDSLIVLFEIIKRGPLIDPDDGAQGKASILTMDKLGIYGSDIARLYQEVCAADLSKMITLLKVWQQDAMYGKQKNQQYQRFKKGNLRPITAEPRTAQN